MVPEIERLMKRGFSRIFMAVHSKQADRIAKPPYGLMRALAGANRCWTYEESGGFVEELLNGYSHRFPYDYLVSDYERWMNLFEPKGEAAHVDII